MKKTLSIILIITMLLSMVIAAVPVGAAEEPAAQVLNSNIGITEPTQPTFNITGNDPANIPEGYDSWDAYKADLQSQGYIPLVNATGDGKPDGAVVPSDDLFKDDNGEKYYVYENISNWAANFTGTPTNITIDGCGHTIGFGNYLMKNISGLTLRNLTISKNGAIGTNAGTNMHSIFGGNVCSGTIIVENVTIDVDVNIGKNNVTVGRGILLPNLGDNSEIDNVKCTVTFNGDAGDVTMAGMGGLFGRIGGAGATISNVECNTTMNVSAATAAATTGGVGGLLGEVIGNNAAISNVKCNTIMNVNVDAGNASAININGIGGLIGRVFGTGAKISNVVTTGAINIVATGANGLTNVAGVGGIVGKTTESSVAFENCFNGISISVGNGAKFAAATMLGGIIGSAVTGTTFKNCVNSGAITVGAGEGDAFNPNITNVGGIVPAIATSDTLNDEDYTFNTCFNKGDIWMKSDAKDVDLTAGSNASGKGQWSIGGITGRFSGLTEFYHCVNTGAVKCEGAMFRSLGGLAGRTVAGDKVVFDGCVNRGEVLLGANADSGGVGGIIGSINNPSAVLSYCYNEGNITTNATHSALAGVGGIVGHLYGGSEKTAVISYCENSGTLSGAESNANASNLVTGGIIGTVAGNQCVPTLSYCVNSGTIGGGKRSAGMIANLRTSGAPETYTATIEYCVNSGTINATEYAAGMLAFVSIEGTPKIAAVDFTSCVNKGTINGGTLSGGITSFQLTGFTLTYTIANCVSFGSCISASANSMSESTITGCIVAGTDITIAPEGFTVTASEVYANPSTELTNALKNKADVLPTHDRTNITGLCTTADKITDSSVYGGQATAFENARTDAKKCLAFAVGNANYFLKQSGTDAKYQTLYDIMYDSDPAMYSVHIPEELTLGEETGVSAQIFNPTEASQLTVKVESDFKLYNSAGSESYIAFYLDGQDKDVTASGTLIEITSSNTEVIYSFTPMEDEENSNAVYPGSYEGTVTFILEFGLNVG